MALVVRPASGAVVAVNPGEASLKAKDSYENEARTGGGLPGGPAFCRQNSALIIFVVWRRNAFAREGGERTPEGGSRPPRPSQLLLDAADRLGLSPLSDFELIWIAQELLAAPIPGARLLAPLCGPARRDFQHANQPLFIL